ncbi:MAG: hypothetical protein LBH44_14600 [Treponema sp.]|jgi:hypothetical protein|nr:hypothetical protein [Treponema sp.]
MKKRVIFLVLVIFIAGWVFAQDDDAEKRANSVDNWISGEVSLLGIGARYERMLDQNWSVGANIYWNNLFLFWNELEIGLSGRYYIWSKTFFVGIGLGFHAHSGTFDYEYTSYGYSAKGTWFGTINGLGISPEIGWKIDVGNPGGFFVQPGVKIPITLGALEMYGTKNNEFRAGIGFVAYCGLGYAF